MVSICNFIRSNYTIIRQTAERQALNESAAAGRSEACNLIAILQFRPDTYADPAPEINIIGKRGHSSGLECPSQSLPRWNIHCDSFGRVVILQFEFFVNAREKFDPDTDIFCHTLTQNRVV